MKLLLIENEARLAGALKRCFLEAGFTVDVAYNDANGVEMALLNEYDALLVDWNLPRLDGKAVVERLRRSGWPGPILILSAHSAVEDRVAGLEAGADDILCKPFSFAELLARIYALLRRPAVETDPTLLKAGPLVLDRRRRRAAYDRVPIPLRPKEYGLLELFMKHPRAVLSRKTIAEHVWGGGTSIRDNTIDVTVANLRNKLSVARKERSRSDRDAVHIRTIHGVGYVLDTEAMANPVS